MRLLASTVPILIAALLGGCGAAAPLSSAGMGEAPPVPQCSGASDCAKGNECHAELSICTATGNSVRQIALVASPLPDSAFAPSHLPRVELHANAPVVDVVLPKTVRLTGRVRVHGNMLDASIEASLLAKASQELIPGEQRAAQAEVKNDFTLVLQAGVEYALSVNAPSPDGDRPLFTKTIRYEADADETIWLPELASLPTLSGQVAQPSGSQTNRLENVRVTAVPESGGTPCTSAVTGKLGEFTLRCPEVGRYRVMVAPTVDGPVIPSFESRLTYGTRRVEAWTVSEGANMLPDITVPPTGPQTEVAIELLGSENLDGSEIVLVAKLPDGEAWVGATIRQSATTDLGGIARLRVPEGNYDLHVIPLTGDAWAESSRAFAVPAESGEIPLLYRQKITGTVTKGDGVLVPYARVSLRRRVADPSTGTFITREHVGETNELGVYEFPADAGTYDLWVEPRTESGLPAFVERGLVMPGPEADVGVTKNVTLADTIVLEGTVYSPDGKEPVQRVLVEALDVAEDGTVTSLGRGRTDELGRYFVILPAR